MKRISQISTHFEIRANFSLTFPSRGWDLFLGVEDCKDPKILNKFKLLFLLFIIIIIFARQGRNARNWGDARNSSYKFLWKAWESHIYYSKPIKSDSEFQQVSKNLLDFNVILMIYYKRKNEIFLNIYFIFY